MASKHMTDLTKVSSISDTDLLLVETSSGTRAIEKSDSDTNLQDQIDSLNSTLSNLFTYSAYSNGIGGQTSFAIGDFAIVVGRKEVATNASGAMDLDVELPYDFITATLCDNAYSMYYIDAESTDNYYASIVHSKVSHNKIFGHLCYHYQSSYCLYTYVVAGKINLT